MSTLMIQGTTSDAGKSAFVTGLCRILKRHKLSVAPFKPQNMALNSAVTSDQGEIGRAQAIQAFAAGIPTHTDMNPVLLKPNSDTGSQIIIQGISIGNMNACEYHAYKAIAQQAVLESYNRLRDQYDVILVEGAGSPAEINLRKNDIANMGFAEKIDCPVLLIADIERGGVFAHLYGTLALLSPSEQARIKGFIINRFRGKAELLTSGINWLEKKCEKRILGVLPYLHDFHLEAEDSLSGTKPIEKKKNALNIIVPALPRLSNHTDFDSLRLHPNVNLQFISTGREIPSADLIILPGSKSVQTDLQWLHNNQWHVALKKHLRYGGKVIGICGGFQMLGKSIHDPLGIEGQAGSQAGFQLFDMETTLRAKKTLRNVTGTLNFDTAKFEGYEIHTGISQGEALSNPAMTFDNKNDGAISRDNQILGTYMHGLFDHPEANHALLRWANLKDTPTFNYREFCDENIDRLADCMEQHLDMSKIFQLLKYPN